MVYRVTPSDVFTMFGTMSLDYEVSPDSSAMMREKMVETPRFANQVDKARWVAAGEPRLPNKDSHYRLISIPTGQFSFIPKGAPLTSEDVAHLSDVPGEIELAITERLRAAVAASVDPGTMLKEFGFLLGQAPLAGGIQRAIWDLIARLPGIHTCGQSSDLLDRRGVGVCADTTAPIGMRVELLVDPESGRPLAIIERLIRQTPAFPTLPAGSVVELATFGLGT
jgi:hypothetical protein